MFQGAGLDLFFCENPASIWLFNLKKSIQPYQNPQFLGFKELAMLINGVSL